MLYLEISNPTSRRILGLNLHILLNSSFSIELLSETGFQLKVSDESESGFVMLFEV